MLRLVHSVTTSLLLLLMLTGTVFSAEKNQCLIAVAAETTELTGQISKVAARAPYFLLFDGQNSLLHTLNNPAINAVGKAGPQAAAFLAEKKVTMVIAGEFGRKMKDALISSHIEIVERQGAIIDVVKEQNNAQ